MDVAALMECIKMSEDFDGHKKTTKVAANSKGKNVDILLIKSVSILLVFFKINKLCTTTLLYTLNIDLGHIVW